MFRELFQGLQVSGHFLGQQLDTTRTKQKGRVDKSAVHGCLLDVQGIGNIDECRLEDRVGDATTHTANTQLRRHGSITDDGMAFKTGLPVQAIDPQERAIATKCRTATGPGGVERIHRAVAVTIPFIERGAEHFEAGAPYFVKAHASGLNLCLADPVVTESWPFPRKLGLK